jgi:hypothetical protein
MFWISRSLTWKPLVRRTSKRGSLLFGVPLSSTPGRRRCRSRSCQTNSRSGWPSARGCPAWSGASTGSAMKLRKAVVRAVSTGRVSTRLWRNEFALQGRFDAVGGDGVVVPPSGPHSCISARPMSTVVDFTADTRNSTQVTVRVAKVTVFGLPLLGRSAVPTLVPWRSAPGCRSPDRRGWAGRTGQPY